MTGRCENTREPGRWRESRLSEALCQTHTAHAAVGRQRDGPRSGKCRWALCDVRWKFSVYDCFARGVSRVRASCTVPRLQVRLLASNNEDLNSQNTSKQARDTTAARAVDVASSTRHRQLRHRPSRGRGAYQAGGTPWASAWVVRDAGSMCALGVRGIGAECAAERVRGEDGAPNASNSTSLPETEGK